MPAIPNTVVIFDLGNVVFDWDVEKILKTLDLGVEDSRLLRRELFSHQDWLDMDHGKALESTIVSKVCERSGLSGDVVENALLVAKNSLVTIEQSIVLMEEISNKGIEMFCLSNMSRETYSHISGHDLFDMFSGIVISGIEGCMKPNDDIFHLAIDRFKVNPSETLFIDDSLPNIETAQRLGINGFHFKRSESCYQRLRSMLFT
jgi:putative hydrolase of the HAD superfamily